MKLLGNFLAGIFMLAMFAILLAVPVWLLWNWLLPDLFNLATISLPQALGLNILCGILFKGNVASTTNKNASNKSE